MSREGYKMTELGEIPQEWEVKEIGSITDLIDGDRSTNYPKQTEIVEEGILFLNTSNIKNNKLQLEEVNFITEEKFKTLSKGKLNRGDIIITLRGSIGNIALFDNVYNTGFINAQMAILRANEERILNRYLYSTLTSSKVQKLMKDSSTGSAQPQLPLKDLKKIQIILPTIPEQQKVADILSTVDEQIEQTDALIEKAKKLKKGLMQRLLTKGSGHTQFRNTEIGEIPNEWEVKGLSEVTTIIMGQSPDSATYNETGDGVPFFQGKTEFGYLYPNVKKWCNKPTKLAEPDDILISVRAPVGDVNLNRIKACIGRGLAAIRKTEKINERYIFYFLQFNKSIFEKLSQGSTFTAINGDDLKHLKIPVPTIYEQNKIALILTEVDNEIIKLELGMIKMLELKKSLMQQLLTGRIRVKV